MPKRCTVFAARSAAAAAAAAATGVMAWRLLAPKAPTLSIEERKAKLTHVADGFAERFPKVPTVTAQQAHNLLQQQPEKYVLIDVRNKEEQRVSMISTDESNVITKETFEQQRDAYKDKTAICYCTVGYRSSVAAQELMSDGLQAASLKGGILAWTQEQFPLVHGTKRPRPTHKVHTYGRKWAYQGDGYVQVYYGNAYVRMVRDALSQIGRGIFRRPA